MTDREPDGSQGPGGSAVPGHRHGPDVANRPESNLESTARTSFDAVILTGGRGRRLGGRDKAALQVAGTPMLQRALAACRGAQRVIVAGQPPVPPGVHQVQEDPPGGGPVAGIVAGLGQVGAPWTLVLAVDQPDAARAVPGLLAAAENENPATDTEQGAGGERGDGGAQRAGSDAAGAACGTRPTASGMERGASAQAHGLAAGSEENQSVVESKDADPADLFCHVDAGGYPQWLLGLYRTASLRAAAERVGTGHGVSVRSLTAGLRIARVLDGGAHVGDVDTWEDHARWEDRLGHSD